MATINNMSIDGIGVHFDDLRPEVQIGDNCLVHMIDKITPHPIEYNCEIIWINTSTIGLKIIGKR